MKRIVLLSGRIGSGKTVLASKLAEKYGALVVKTGELIANRVPGAKGFGRVVTHIHLTAPESVLVSRYEKRARKLVEFSTYCRRDRRRKLRK